MKSKKGNCYVACEALYHLLKKGPLKLTPMTVQHEGGTHWFLAFTFPDGNKFILDPTAKQFKTPVPYHRARGRGFLTKRPSKRARMLIKKLVWQESK